MGGPRGDRVDGGYRLEVVVVFTVGHSRPDGEDGHGHIPKMMLLYEEDVDERVRYLLIQIHYPIQARLSAEDFC